MAVAKERRVGCEGCGQIVPLDELTAVQMPNGETVACCSGCVAHAKAAAEKSAGIDQRRQSCDGCTEEFLETKLEAVTLSDGTTVDCCRSCAAAVPGRETDDAKRPQADPNDAETTICQQCNEWVSAEPFRVTTIDGRNERLCPACKTRAEENGVIRTVELRKSRAREILGVEDGASDERIREAYHTQVKRAHPDRQSGSRSAFQLVKDAYDRLQERQGC